LRSSPGMRRQPHLGSLLPGTEPASRPRGPTGCVEAVSAPRRACPPRRTKLTPLLALGQVARLPRRMTRLVAVAAAVARAEARISQRTPRPSPPVRQRAQRVRACAAYRRPPTRLPGRRYAFRRTIATHFGAGFRRGSPDWHDRKSRASKVRNANDANTTRSRKRADGSDFRARAIACDFCGSPHSSFERQRVVWSSGSETELVLAELCSRCAADAGRLLDLYGGHGRNTIRLTRGRRVAAVHATRAARLTHALVYLLVALAAFVLVTLISSLR
jgi:hypothetical protein